jgi:hypothetical protein
VVVSPHFSHKPELLRGPNDPRGRAEEKIKEYETGMNQEFVGVDVSKDSLDMAAYSAEQVIRFSNDEPGIGKAVNWLKKVKPTITVMEATGGLEVPVYVALQEAELPVAVMNPRQIRDSPIYHSVIKRNIAGC